MSKERDMKAGEPELFDHTDDDPAKTGGLEDEDYTGPLSGAAIPLPEPKPGDE